MELKLYLLYEIDKRKLLRTQLFQREKLLLQIRHMRAENL